MGLMSLPLLLFLMMMIGEITHSMMEEERDESNQSWRQQMSIESITVDDNKTAQN